MMEGRPGLTTGPAAAAGVRGGRTTTTSVVEDETSREDSVLKGNSRLGLYMGHAANKAHFFYCTEGVRCILSLKYFFLTRHKKLT